MPKLRRKLTPKEQREKEVKRQGQQQEKARKNARMRGELSLSEYDNGENTRLTNFFFGG